MINYLFIGLGVLCAVVNIAIDKSARNSKRVIDICLLYALLFGVGVCGLFGGSGHLFIPNKVAKMIGWPPGSPFQFEVGMHDMAWGTLGVLCIWIRGTFRLATGLGWSIFMLGAAYGHIKQTIVAGNFAPYNVGMILPDILIPVIILSLFIAQAVVSRKT